MKQTEKSTVYIIDDHPLLVQGLTQLIDAQPDLRLQGHSADWTVALSDLQKQKADIVLLDITLKNSNGLEVLKNFKVHFPDMHVLMLSMHEESLYAMRVMKAGAHGYIMKAEATERLIAAIRAVLKGGMYLSEKMTRASLSQLVGRKKSDGTSLLDDLSDRELEILQMIGDGMSTRQMAEKLQRSGKTIETHRQHIKEKLNLKNSTELVQHAIHWRS